MFSLHGKKEVVILNASVKEEIKYLIYSENIANVYQL